MEGGIDVRAGGAVVGKARGEEHLRLFEGASEGHKGPPRFETPRDLRTGPGEGGSYSPIGSLVMVAPMKVRAVLPSFLPVDEIRRRVGPVLPGLDVVEEPLDRGSFAPEEVEVLILTTFTPLPREVLAHYPALRFVQVASTGYDAVDLPACRDRRIMVSNIPVANSTSVAEHVILLALSLLRDLPRLDRALREGQWPLLTGGRDLRGRVFGILGMGRIGRALAARLLPFETSTIYHDLVPLPRVQEETLGVTRVDWEDLLGSSEILSVHLPLTPRTRGILGPTELSRLPEGAILINTARGELLDMKAVRERVSSGTLRVALDVYETEPPDFQDPLFQTPGTVFTPHVAGVTRESQERFVQETIKNVLRFLQGKEPLYRVDIEPGSGTGTSLDRPGTSGDGL